MKRTPIRRRTPLRSRRRAAALGLAIHDLVQVWGASGWVTRIESTRVEVQIAEGPHKGALAWHKAAHVARLSGPVAVAGLLRAEGVVERDPAFLRVADHALPPIRPVLAVVRPRTLPPQPKPTPPARSLQYRAYVRAHMCCNPECQAPAPSDCHHDGPRGVRQKTSDYLTAPLCRRCHRSITDTDVLPGLDKLETRAAIYQAQARLLARWAELQAAELDGPAVVPVWERTAS